ncbi:hypothetical protein BC939DRAFT_482166 [Gamsiella multidivaricata]|uniref:uncharacterized protein n=1 Tax=Gamsiella multidivaricata TaxID=101098 RepID=UPI00221E7F9C|nr:uncharacterized protein BC939DRAFT_482166 [Gamsiella multidivaricata]KAI7816295.1 hypothetical protein BC939DRAFT_482166 [Gamsiella multidivaricata]
MVVLNIPCILSKRFAGSSYFSQIVREFACMLIILSENRKEDQPLDLFRSSPTRANHSIEALENLKQLAQHGDIQRTNGNSGAETGVREYLRVSLSGVLQVLAFDIRPCYQSSKDQIQMKDIETLFPDSQAYSEAFGQYRDDMDVAGGRPRQGKAVSTTFYALDTHYPSLATNQLVRWVALSQPDVFVQELAESKRKKAIAPDGQLRFYKRNKEERRCS